MFNAGIVLGLVVSILYYLALGNQVFGGIPLAGALIAKTTAGIALACFPRWRPLGLGLITSIPVAVLIFFGLCFAVLAMN